MRNFILAVILFLGVVFIFTRLSEIEAIASTLQKGKWWVLSIAFFIQLLWIANVAASYFLAFRIIGVQEDLREMMLITSAVYFANIAAPIGGMSGIAIFVDRARRRGYSPARSAIANTLYYAFDYLGFILILVLGLAVLVRRNNLHATELMASLALVALAIAITSLIVLGMKSQNALEKTLLHLAQGINRLANPFIHRQLIPEGRVRNFSSEVSAGLQELRYNPRKILAPLGLGLSSKILMMMVFALMFVAFNVPISIGTVIAGYSIAFLFMIISPTPLGLGFVEGALTLALGSMYIPLGTAVVLTVAYRAFTFWLPFGVGLIAFRWLSRLSSTQSAPTSQENQ